MKSLQLTSASEGRTVALGRAIGARVADGDCIALRGELGAGKTRFVRGLAMGMGIDPSAVSSPTYTIANEYESSAGRVLVHVDAYRFEAAGEDLDAIGWDTMISGGCVLCVEWPDRIAEAIPSGAVWIEILHVGASDRRVTVRGPEGWPGWTGIEAWRAETDSERDA